MPVNTCNVNIRMDKEIKQQADAMLADFGLSLSSAVNIFVRQMLREGRIPFSISYNHPNRETRQAMREAERIANDPSVPGYTNLDELFDELKK